MALLVGALAFLSPAGATATEPFAPDILGTRALAASAHPYRDRWEMLAQVPAPAQLATLVEPVRDASRLKQAELVNALVQSIIRYREDADMWGKADHWADPRESWGRRAGDCEDVAILKRAALVHLGVPEEDLLLLVGKRDDGSDHALLAMRSEEGWLYLDDLPLPTRDRAARGFKPIFSMTATQSWLHGRDASGLRPAAR